MKVNSACLAAVLLWGSVSLAGEAAPRDAAGEIEYRKCISEGAKLLSEGEKDKALGRFRSACKLVPEAAEPYYWMALTYGDYRNFAEAADFAQKATLCTVKMEQEYLPWLVWGQSLMYLGRWDEARDKLEAADRLFPGDPIVVFNRARCYYHGAKNYSDALPLFKRAVDLIGRNRTGRFAPVYLRAKLYIGCCYMKSDMNLAAISVFEELLQLDPGNTEAQLRLGVAYRLEGRTAEAERALREVVKQEPKNYEAALQAGHFYLKEKKDPALAAIFLRLYLKYAPETHAWRKAVTDWLAAQKSESGGGE